MHSIVLLIYENTFRYDPLNKFMLLKQCEWPAANVGSVVDNSVFEMIITPELEYRE